MHGDSAEDRQYQEDDGDGDEHVTSFRCVCHIYPAQAGLHRDSTNVRRAGGAVMMPLPMSLLIAVLVIAVANAVGVGAMLLLRRRTTGRLLLSGHPAGGWDLLGGGDHVCRPGGVHLPAGLRELRPSSHRLSGRVHLYHRPVPHRRAVATHDPWRAARQPRPATPAGSSTRNGRRCAKDQQSRTVRRWIRALESDFAAAEVRGVKPEAAFDNWFEQTQQRAKARRERRQA